MEIGLLEAIIGFILATSALIGMVVLSVQLSAKQSKAAFAVLDRELTDEKGETKRLRDRVFNLEEKRKDRTRTITKLEDTVDTLTGQVETLLTQMKDMQARAAQSELREKAKDDEITRLKKENERVIKQAEDLFETNKSFQAQHIIWEKMIDKFTPKPHGNTTEPPAAVIVTGAMGDQTTTDTQEKTTDGK